MMCLLVAQLRLEGKYVANLRADGALLLELCARFFAIPRSIAAIIDFWLLPLRGCFYIKIRVILWRDCGRFAGLLLGLAAEKKSAADTP